MANPTPAAITAIRARVTDWSPADREIRDALNTRSMANPAAQLQVPKPMTVGALMGRLGQASRAKIGSRPGLSQCILDVRAGDRPAVKNWVQLFSDLADITVDEAGAIVAEVDATIGDPEWLPLLSWAEIELGRLVDTDDIVAARP